MARRIKLNQVSPESLSNPSENSQDLMINQSGIMGTKNSSGVFNPIGGGNGGGNTSEFEYAEIFIPSSQILMLGWSSGWGEYGEIELLPSPGVNKFYYLEEVTFEYKFNTTAYTISNPSWHIIFVNYDIPSILSQALIGGNSSTFIRLKRNTITNQYGEIYYINNHMNSIKLGYDEFRPTNGDGDMLIKIKYQIYDINQIGIPSTNAVNGNLI
jgi:hypothetical protein